MSKEFFNENPRDIAIKTFHENFHYLSGDLSRTREFYKQILIDTGLVRIKHNPNEFNNLELTNSTYRIYKILIVKQCVVITLTYQGNFPNLPDKDFIIIRITREPSSMLF